ncbi:MAG: hypothetical protein EB084_18660 [Proteobacteria bacterium]|nr:hypothetical protein [Pseudomonadota bacterium]
MTERTAMRETQHLITTRWPAEMETAFIDWSAGQQGQQTFLKLTREDDAMLLYAGVAGVVDADVSRELMRLTSEGWGLQGEVAISFDGAAQLQMEAVFGPEGCVLEIGAGLLPLVDPFQRAPLIEKVRDVRRDLAVSLGITVPGIEVRDDLTLDPAAYRLRLRGVEVACGQVFLDRILVVGTLDQLSSLQGWTTTEPTYRLPAKWIEPTERERAEALQCTLLGGLAVLLTHVRESLRAHAATLLGLQETHDLLVRLRRTHPVVVGEFLDSVGRVRALRHVLRSLLSEGVSIRDMVTILEVLGDRLDGLDDTVASTEAARQALAREILLGASDADGVVRALVLDEEVETRLQGPPPGPLEPDPFVRAVRDAAEEHPGITVVFTRPETRRAAAVRLGQAVGRVSVLSVAEIVPGPHVEIAGTVKWPREAESPEAASKVDAPSDDAPAGFWKSRKKR